MIATVWFKPKGSPCGPRADIALDDRTEVHLLYKIDEENRLWFQILGKPEEGWRISREYDTGSEFLEERWPEYEQYIDDGL